MIYGKKVAAIIAEYNPFHNGHKYHIEETKRRTGADYVVILMSTNFVQRGEPAILDRYLRAKIALQYGADAVFELPVTISTASADIFSFGGVSLAHHLGIVDYLSFGAESENLSALTETALLLLDNKEFELSMKRSMAQGLTFPEAREAYLLAHNYIEEAKLLKTSNNILALSYITNLLKLSSNIQPIAILRKAVSHDSSSSCEKENIASAKLIRDHIKENKTKEVVRYLPEYTGSLMENSKAHLSHQDLNDLLFFKLSTIIYTQSKEKAIQKLASYQDVSLDLAHRIYKYLNAPFSYPSFAGKLWSKNLTYGRIDRLLCHILLGITKDILAEHKKVDFCPYIRPLGVKKSSLELLTGIKQSLPNHKKKHLLTRISDIKKLNCPIASKTFRLNFGANTLYRHLLESKYKVSVKDEAKEDFVLML